MALNLSAQKVPGMFYDAHVRRIWGPRESFVQIFGNPGTCNSGCVLWVIVLLENNVQHIKTLVLQGS
jgi:hypothetical protein